MQTPNIFDGGHLRRYNVWLGSRISRDRIVLQRHDDSSGTGRLDPQHISWVEARHLLGHLRHRHLALAGQPTRSSSSFPYFWRHQLTIACVLEAGRRRGRVRRQPRPRRRAWPWSADQAVADLPPPNTCHLGRRTPSPAPVAAYSKRRLQPSVGRAIVSGPGGWMDIISGASSVVPFQAMADLDGVHPAHHRPIGEEALDALACRRLSVQPCEHHPGIETGAHLGSAARSWSSRAAIPLFANLPPRRACDCRGTGNRTIRSPSTAKSTAAPG
jgi:hypothetical protein